MRSIFILFAVLIAFQAQAKSKAPQYSLSSKEIYGEYEQLTTDFCTEVPGNGPCLGARVKAVGKNAVIELVDYDATLSLYETKNGRVVFNWINKEDDDCDDPGCWNLLGLSGVIYAKKKGNQYVPALKVFVKKDFPYPGEEDDREGEVIETENFIKRK